MTTVVVTAGSGDSYCIERVYLKPTRHTGSPDHPGQGRRSRDP